MSQSLYRWGSCYGCSATGTLFTAKLAEDDVDSVNSHRLHLLQQHTPESTVWDSDDSLTEWFTQWGYQADVCEYGTVCCIGWFPKSQEACRLWIITHPSRRKRQALSSRQKLCPAPTRLAELVNFKKLLITGTRNRADLSAIWPLIKGHQQNPPADHDGTPINSSYRPWRVYLSRGMATPPTKQGSKILQ